MLSCRPGFERLGNDGLASARFNAVVPEQAFVYVCSIAPRSAPSGLAGDHPVPHDLLTATGPRRRHQKLVPVAVRDPAVAAGHRVPGVPDGHPGHGPGHRIALYTVPLWAGRLIGGYLLAKPGMAREAAAKCGLQQTQAAAGV